MAPKIVAIFNHKGGVGKTTTTCSVGWRLAQDHRVLLVDADPQCNLTGFLVDPAPEFFSPVEVDRETLPDPLERFYEDFRDCNIKASLDLALNQQNAGNAEVPLNVFRVADRKQFLVPPGEPPPEIPVDSAPPNNLFLLGGHMQFYQFESRFQLATGNISAFPNAVNIPGIFSHLFERLGEKYQLDFIIIDLSPSASLTNCMIVMSSDFLLVPCSPDFYSFMAVQSITELLVEWHEWKMRILRQVDNHPNKNEIIWEMKEHSPIFLGHTLQIFTLSSRPNEGITAAAAFRKWIKKIDDSFKDNMVPILLRRGLCYPFGNGPTEIVKIRNFQSVGAASTHSHVPVFALTPSLLKSTSTNSRQATQIITHAEEVFGTLASTLEVRPANIDEQVYQLQFAWNTLASVNFPVGDMAPTDIIKIAQNIRDLIERRGLAPGGNAQPPS